MTTQFIDNPSEAQDAGDVCFEITDLGTISGGGQALIKLVKKNGQLAIIKKYKNVAENERELSVLQTLKFHKNIVKLLDMSFIPPGKSPTEFGIPLEYIYGKMLWEFIYGTDKRIPQISIGKYVYLLSEALDHCHRLGVVHRDVKAENIMITDTDSVKLIDFGMSHSKTMEPIVGVVGTPIYMAPETLRREAHGPSVDIWALGVIMFECFTKTLPFGLYDGSELRENILNCRFVTPLSLIPMEPRAVVKRLLEPDASKRISLKNLASSQWIMQIKAKIYQEKRTSMVRHNIVNQATPKKPTPNRPFQLKPTPQALRHRRPPALLKLEASKTPVTPKAPKPAPKALKRDCEASVKTIKTSRCNSDFSIRTDSTQKETPQKKQTKAKVPVTPVRKVKTAKPKDADFVHTDLTRQPIPRRVNRPQPNPNKAEKRPAWRF
uniref:Protein kinase domain-containing protein n=1 Tax=Panagrellus redivivus TaxID=6233 RepID=A0A7E4ZZB2_PANRE